MIDTVIFNCCRAKNIYNELQNNEVWSKGRLLGRGKFGDVYSYTLIKTGDIIAVKEVKFDPSDPKVSLEVKALQNEIDKYSRLSNERIVKYFGSTVDMNHFILSICLEFIPGGSLYKCLHNDNGGQPFTESRVRKFTRQILEGVKYLHDNLIVHRDIKGANILRDNCDNVKLVDFGTSKQLNSMSRGASTRGIGSYYYMAPEVMIGKEEYGVKADIWSLGCTVVEMLCANPPWYPMIEIQVITNVHNGVYPIFKLPDETSNDAKLLLENCFQANPTLRPTAAKLLQTNFCNELL